MDHLTLNKIEIKLFVLRTTAPVSIIEIAQIDLDLDLARERRRERRLRARGSALLPMLCRADAVPPCRCRRSISIVWPSHPETPPPFVRFLASHTAPTMEVSK